LRFYLIMSYLFNAEVTLLNSCSSPCFVELRETRMRYRKSLTNYQRQCVRKYGRQVSKCYEIDAYLRKFASFKQLACLRIDCIDLHAISVHWRGHYTRSKFFLEEYHLRGRNQRQTYEKTPLFVFVRGNAHFQTVEPESQMQVIVVQASSKRPFLCTQTQ